MTGRTSIIRIKGSVARVSSNCRPLYWNEQPPPHHHTSTPHVGGGSCLFGRSSSGTGKFSTGYLEAEFRPLLVDVFDRVQFSFIAAGANFRGLGPRFWRGQVRVPKRPSTTLSGAGLVHAAAAGLGVKENTVAIFVFLETLSDANIPHVLTLERGDVHFDGGGQIGNLLLVHPYESWRTRTAIATLRTLKA